MKSQIDMEQAKKIYISISIYMYSRTKPLSKEMQTKPNRQAMAFNEKLRKQRKTPQKLKGRDAIEKL